MKPILLLLVFLFIINKVDAQWSIKHFNENSENKGIVKFRNDSLGIFMGENSTCLKTIDTGETWEKKIVNINGDINILDFQFIGDSSVIAVGIDYDTKILSSELIRSDNLGESWSCISNYLNKYLECVWFFTIDSGLIAGDYGIYRTNDGGSSLDTVWSISQSGYKFGEVTQFYFPTPVVGYAIGYGLNKQTNQFDHFLLKTQDTGITWDTIKTFYHTGLSSEYFINQDTGFVGTEGGEILKTTDGGHNWNKIKVGDSGSIRSIQFISEMKGFAVGGDQFFITAGEELNATYTGGFYVFVISKTTDGGESWISYDTLGIDLSSVYFINNSLGFVSGRYELIMKSNGKDINELPEDYPWYLINTGGSGVAEKKQINTDVNVYPNPVQETLTIEFKNQGKFIKSVSLINIFGQTLNYSCSPPNNQLHYDLSGFSPGIYFVKVEYFDETKIKKIIKQ